MGGQERKRGEGKKRRDNGLIAPAEPEAQACRLWWMVGFDEKIACCGKFCLVT